MPELRNIPLDQIRTNPAALREVNLNSQSFQELRDSIKTRGVLNAIVVRNKTSEDDDKPFELIDGLQRFAASEQAGKADIPAQVLDREDADVYYDQIVTNAIRVETKPAEYAAGLKRILSGNPTMTEGELAAKLNKSPVWISKQLSLNKLDDNIKKLVDDNKIPLYNAYALATLPSDEQPQWLERAQSEASETFVQQVAERAKAIRAANRAGRTPGEAQFTPVPRFRKKTEVLDALNNPTFVGQMVKDTGILEKFDNPADQQREIFRLALQWAVSLDPATVEDDRKKWEDQKKKDEAERIKRAAERAEKRAQETAAARKAIEEGRSPETITNPATAAAK